MYSLCSLKTHQWFDGAEIFDLVATEVEMGEIGTFLCQYLQTTRDSVIAKLELLQTKTQITFIKDANARSAITKCFSSNKNTIFVPF